MKNKNCCNHPSTCVYSPNGKNCYLQTHRCSYESSDAEKLMREYFKFNDINQSETINVLPLSIIDCLEEYNPIKKMIDFADWYHIMRDAGELSRGRFTDNEIFEMYEKTVSK